MMSIPARLLLTFYIGFLIFYFIPWNLKNIEKADDIEENLLLHYGMVGSHDTLEITLIQLYALFNIIFSILSIIKCFMIAIASTKEVSNIWIYPITIFLSITMSLILHDKFINALFNNNHSSAINTSTYYDSTLFTIHPILAVIRGIVFHSILYPKPIQDVVKKGIEKPIINIVKDVSLLLKCYKMSTTFWFFTYWLCYIVMSSLFYNEIVKYILEEHINMSTIINFVLV